MKKKFIAVFLVVATLLSCVFAFAACDKDKDKDKGGKNGGTNNELYDGTFNLANVESVLRYLMAYVSVTDEIFPKIIYSYDDDETPPYSIIYDEFNYEIHDCGSKERADEMWSDYKPDDDEYYARVDDEKVAYFDSKTTYEKIKNMDLSKCIWPAKIVEDMITFAKQVQLEKKGSVIITDRKFFAEKNHPGLVEFIYSQVGASNRQADLVSYALIADVPESSKNDFNDMVLKFQQLSEENKVEILEKSENYIKVKYKNN